MALNETLYENSNILDGMAITNKMWNRDFDGESHFPFIHFFFEKKMLQIDLCHTGIIHDLGIIA